MPVQRYEAPPTSSSSRDIVPVTPNVSWRQVPLRADDEEIQRSEAPVSECLPVLAITGGVHSK